MASIQAAGGSRLLYRIIDDCEGRRVECEPKEDDRNESQVWWKLGNWGTTTLHDLTC